MSAKVYKQQLRTNAPDCATPLVNIKKTQLSQSPVKQQSPQPPPASSDVTDDGNRGKVNIDLLKNSYEERLKTYCNRWRVPFLEAEALARAGFYYTGYSDIVCCPFCNVEVGKWVPGDDPLADHIKWSPNCRFTQLQDMQVQNDNTQQRQQQASTSSHVETAAGATATVRGQDTCGKYGIIQSASSIPENSSVVGGGAISPSANLSSVAGVQQVKAPCYKHYGTIEKRLETFQDWPVSIAQKPKELAEAGFFYTGKSDQTVCFHCGGGLKDWECNDQPWQQHAKWFPKCPFVILQKGMEYITEQQEQQEREQAAGGAGAEPGAQAAAETAALAVSKVEDKDDPLESMPNIALCKICFSKEVGVVFLPCGHMVACVDCAPVLTTCAVCRKKVDAHIRAFLS